MATIKSYTDIEQSKKLAKILPLESADMVLLHEEPYETSDSKFDGLHQVLCVPFDKYDKSWRQKYKNISYFPCWSLTSLLSTFPVINSCTPSLRITITHEYYVEFCIDYFEKKRIITDYYESPVDACVAMIERLHELKIL
jgi:hypothetical protein